MSSHAQISPQAVNGGGGVQATNDTDCKLEFDKLQIQLTYVRAVLGVVALSISSKLSALSRSFSLQTRQMVGVCCDLVPQSSEEYLK